MTDVRARTPDPDLAARAEALMTQYTAYEEVGDLLETRLREYAEDCRAAGLVERWNDVANARMYVTWDPGYGASNGFHFLFTDRDGDSGSLFLPAEYLLDPAGYIATQVRLRREKEEETERLRLAEEAAARPAKIAELQRQLSIYLDQERGRT